MKAVKLTEKNSKKILSEAERILRSEGIIIVPTDTVYGIVGRADDASVIRKILALKQRPQERAFPIFVKNVAEARKLAFIADAKAKFLEHFWPGPVTVVFQHKEKLPKVLTPHRSDLRSEGAGLAGGLGTIAMRIPDSPFLLELLSRLDFPLAQTSANISEKPPAKNVKEIKEYFGKAKIKPDLVVDGGELQGKSSTVIDYTGKEPMILRTGVITREDLDQILESMR